MTITEQPDKWVLIKIDVDSKDYFKVFATWTGGYLGSDRWKLNSGIKSVTNDDNNYYFHGYSGSIYKCNINSYGILTSLGHDAFARIMTNGGNSFSLVEDYKSVINDLLG